MKKKRTTAPSTARLPEHMRRVARGATLQRAHRFTDRKKAANKNACRGKVNY